jgi:hypothetical protein
MVVCALRAHSDWNPLQHVCWNGGLTRHAADGALKHQPVILVRALNRTCQVLLPPTTSQTM